MLPDSGPLPDGGAVPGDPDAPTLEVNGLVGQVLDTTGAPLALGRVVLVRAADVATLVATPFDPTLAPAAAAASTVDEPLEDLLDDTTRAYASATIDSLGMYRFVTLADEDVFVVVVPPAGDAGHLPGGEASRMAQARASLVGTRLDLRVSTRPSEDAVAVGSATCLSCHGRHETLGTAHFAGLSVPRRPGYLADRGDLPGFDAALDRFDAGITLYFSACDTAQERVCAISETPPGGAAVVSFEATLARDSAFPLGTTGAYRVTLTNRRGAGSASYPVELTYGGALGRMAFVVPTTRAGGTERHVLPFQFQATGSEPATDRRLARWGDIGSSAWYDHTAGTLRTPASSQSFDVACAGCHVNGYSLDGSAATGFFAHAVTTPAGAFDYDLDGRLEEMGIGCEGCHGAGSEHVAASGRGVAIVSPGLTTPERETAICGSCHGRGIGHIAGAGAPLDVDGHMPRPGLRRSELLERHHTGPEAAAGDLHASGDPRRAQLEYLAHISSPMFRNASTIVTCTSCHDLHGGSEGTPHDLFYAPDDNAGCTSCHGTAEFLTPRTHVTTATTFAHAATADADLLCTTCHMPDTAVGGAMSLGLLDDRPAGPPPIRHLMGDLPTHRYLISGFDVANDQPASVTQACAPCHALSIAGP